MRNRAINYYGLQRQEIYNKATHVTSVTVNRPVVQSETFSIFADKLNGDHVSYYAHEFRKNIGREYLGTYVREDSTSILTQSGYTGSYTKIDYNSTDWTNLYNSAIADMYSQIRSGDVGSGLDLSVDIAEGRQVASMLRQTARLTEYIRSFHPRQWSRRWLEYQYGWRPLVQSVYGTTEAIMHRRLYNYMRVQGKSRDNFRSEKSFSNTFFPGSLEKVYRDSKSRVMAVAEFEIANTVRQRLAGYTSLNPVSIAWELMPYSFVVDWVYDIGGYLRNLESALLYAQGFKKGYVVYGYRDIQDAFGSGFATVSGVKHALNSNAKYYQSYKRRSPMGVYPLPRIPRFNSNFGWQRLISAASLLSLHLGRR